MSADVRTIVGTVVMSVIMFLAGVGAYHVVLGIMSGARVTA